MQHEPPSTMQLAGAAMAGALFTLLARAVVRDDPPAIDRTLHDLAEASYSRALEIVLAPIEVVGLPGLYIPIATLAARRLARRGRGGGRTIVTASVAGWVALRVSRMLYARRRPPRPPHRGPKTERSFPSGHTTGLTTLATAAAIVLAREGVLSRREASALGVGVPLLTGFNRVYVREHWATDVVGGWLLGVGVALAVTASRLRRPDAPRSGAPPCPATGERRHPRSRASARRASSPGSRSAAGLARDGTVQHSAAQRIRPTRRPRSIRLS